MTEIARPTEPLCQCIADLDPRERTPCEIWTRVMGYHRPVTAFNAGKQAEFAQRKYFKESCDDRQ